MASTKVKQQFDALKDALRAAPDVAGNAAVNKAMSDMQAEVNKNEDLSAVVGMIFGSRQRYSETLRDIRVAN